MKYVQQCQGNLVTQMLSLLWCTPASMLPCMLHLLLMFEVLCHAHSTQMACCATLPKQCLRTVALHRQHSQLQYEDFDSMHAALQCTFGSWRLALAWSAACNVLPLVASLFSDRKTDQSLQMHAAICGASYNLYAKEASTINL